MQVRMLRNLLGVTKIGKSSKRNSELFASAEVTFNMGVIKYVGVALKDQFSVGQKVAIGGQREEIRLNGEEVMVMEEKNVFAVIEESDEEQTEPSA